MITIGQVKELLESEYGIDKCIIEDLNESKND